MHFILQDCRKKNMHNEKVGHRKYIKYNVLHCHIRQMFSSALSWTKLFILFNISLIVIAFILCKISPKYYTLLVITGVVTNVDWALHWQRLQCLNNCKWKQLFMTYPVALRSHLDSSGRVQPFHINLYQLKKVIVLLIHYITMLNISLLIFWWIEYCLLMFMQLCIYVYHHHCIEYEPFWMTIYWCCFVIISLCSPISNVRSINMNFCRHFKKWFQWTSIMIYLTKTRFLI